MFQVHGIDATGEVVLRRRLTRARLTQFFGKLAPCLVGIEACATSHHWGRELRKLGHDVRLMPPSYVKPYVKRQKNYTADAEAICEAVTRPTMRFVEVKSPQQQSVMVLHRTRVMLMRQRVQLSNAIRGHMAEFGLVAPVGRKGLLTLTEFSMTRETRAVAAADLASAWTRSGIANSDGVRERRGSPETVIPQRLQLQAKSFAPTGQQRSGQRRARQYSTRPALRANVLNRSLLRTGA